MNFLILALFLFASSQTTLEGKKHSPCKVHTVMLLVGHRVRSSSERGKRQ